MADDPNPVSIAVGQASVSATNRFPVAATIVEPVGGGITWTKSAVTANGSSQTWLAANAARKGFIVANAAVDSSQLSSTSVIVGTGSYRTA